MIRRTLAVLLLSAIFASTTFAGEDPCRRAYLSADAVTELHQCHVEADAGKAEAQLGYALILWSGYDRDSQPEEALRWFRRAARQGNLLARVALGRFLTSEEVPPVLRNKAEGYAWWLVSGQLDSASDLRQRMSVEEVAEGERMAKDFLVDYGPNR